ncbi:hypothetical protein DFH29DRAFT_1004983 [Suillus ampliporus]|nr:hypothetical protein DFH29DRAFT_1004983 [Suillus ampliporus]
MSYGQFDSKLYPDRPISPCCPLNGWINNGGWIGIDPPHFYLTNKECQHALFYHTDMPEHPQMPKTQRNCIWEPTVPIVQPPALLIVVDVVAGTALILPIAEITLVPPVGHLVSILMNFSAQVQDLVTCDSEVVKKKSKLTKSDYIMLKGITCIDFITAYLSIAVYI